MKKLIIAFMLCFTYTVFAAGLPELIVDTVTPQPVEPGRDLTIALTLYNKLGIETGPFDVFLDIQPPFILKSADEGTKQITLCSSCKKKITYFMAIDPNAISGTYALHFRLQSSGIEQKQKIDVKVHGKPSLVVSLSDESPKNITPDSQFSAVLFVTNIGSGNAKQIKVELDSKDFVSFQGSAKSLDSLEPNQSKALKFDLFSASALEATSYSVQLKISYLDEQGNQLNTTQSFGLRVLNKATINIQAIKIASVIKTGQPLTIIARLENIGPGDADSVTADITCPFSATRKAFLGQLKSGSDAPAVFDFVPLDSGSFTCDLIIAYQDDTGGYKLSEKMDISIAKDSQASIYILIPIAAVLLVVLRKRIFGKVSQ